MTTSRSRISPRRGSPKPSGRSRSRYPAESPPPLTATADVLQASFRAASRMSRRARSHGIGARSACFDETPQSLRRERFLAWPASASSRVTVVRARMRAPNDRIVDADLHRVGPRGTDRRRQRTTSAVRVRNASARMVAFRRRPAMAQARRGEMAEWSKAPDSKSGIGFSLSWVRIPLSPPLHPRAVSLIACLPAMSRWP